MYPTGGSIPRMSFTPFLAAVADATAVAPEAPDQQLLDVDGTVFLTLALFLITAATLTRWLWKPYLRVRDERVSRVAGHRQEAARLDAEAQTRLARVEIQLGDARRAVSAERARLRAEAAGREQAIVAAAQESANRTLAEARTRVEAALAAERAHLQERGALLGREITQKVLGREVAS